MLSYMIVPLIVAMSCLIAYLGDHIGRRLGKRRLTLFGLRPRHTAVLITVLTGMLIACATLGAMMVINTDVRRALLQYPEIKAALDQAKIDSTVWHNQANAAHTLEVAAQKRLEDMRCREALAE